MKIAELMTMDVATCSPGDSLTKAAQLMWERDCGCVRWSTAARWWG